MSAQEQVTDIKGHWPEQYKPNWSLLANASSEDAYGEAAFELLKEASILATLAGALVPQEPQHRDDAILCALMVKVCKLGKATVAMTSHLGGDRQLALFRELIEALAVLRYLLQDEGDGVRFTRFVHNSLVVEREFLKTLRENVAQRDTEWKIEASMARSIQNTALAAGIEDIDTIPARSRNEWPSAEQLVRELGPNDYLAYRTGSSVLHSQWSDLLRNHLIQAADGHFTPNFDDVRPRPQPLYASGLLMIKTTGDYLTKTRPEASATFTPRLGNLTDRLQRVFELHGSWLDALEPADRPGPETVKD